MAERDWRLFPDENPNLVIESDTAGTVRYANPEAMARFPDIVAVGWRHPLLAGIHEIIGGFATGRDEHVTRRIDLGDEVFEQKICFSAVGDEVLIRVYTHDVTALTRAEEAMHELARRVVVAQEEERHRVSRELHDEAGQALAALKISLQLMRDDLDDTAGAGFGVGLDDAVALVETTRDQIRIIAHDLRPPVLDGLGLDRTLQSFCADFARRTHLAISYSSNQPPGASDAVEISLYRLLQEALSNVAVHSKATAVDVALDASDGRLTLSVVDNGTGFDGAIPSSGIGIAGMRERIRLLNGTFEIESRNGAGTSVIASLPVA
jgi:signal transduction histidine kinase